MGGSVRGSLEPGQAKVVAKDDHKEPQAWREIGGAFAASFALIGFGTLVIFHDLTIGKVVGGGMLAFSAGWFLLVGKVPL